MSERPCVICAGRTLYRVIAANCPEYDTPKPAKPELCPATTRLSPKQAHEPWCCSLPLGHEGDHQHIMNGRVMARWGVIPAEPAPESEFQKAVRGYLRSCANKEHGILWADLAQRYPETIARIMSIWNRALDLAAGIAERHDTQAAREIELLKDKE